MIRVVLDACVLYSASLRDLLLWLAYAELFCPLWSETIHEEWMRNLLSSRSDLSWERLERTRQKMDREFPHSLVREHESIIPLLRLPDPNDRHVVAVAIHAEAKYIVTFNLNDFPKTTLQTYEIEALSPDEFILRLIQHVPRFVLRAVKRHRLNLSRPAKTPDEYLATLEKQKLPKTVAFLREHKDEI